ADFIARLGDLVENQPREEQAATQPENADVVRLMSIHQAKGLEFPVVVLPDLAAAVGGAHLPVAHWDARLGCAVRPPPDEETPPFSDQAWALWRMREDVEDWHESLRILYVACTRARDYLVLSAALPPDLPVNSPWLQTLAAKFDLRSGACLVPADGPPRIAVRGSAIAAEEAPPPLPSAPAPAIDVVGRPEPIPLRGSGQLVFTVEELEAFLEDPVAARSAWEQGTFADSFDRETSASATASPKEHVLHQVLRNANLADPQQWQPFLRRCAA